MSCSRLLATCCAVATVFVSFAPLSASAQKSSQIDELQGMVAEWTELRRLISEERADWKVEKVYLEDSLDILTKQIEMIESQLEETEGVGEETGQALEKLNVRRDALLSANEAVQSTVGGLETAVKRLVKRFPPPLLDTVEPLLRRIPEDPTDTDLPVSQRVQNVVAVVSLAEKFNTSLIKRGEVREFAGQEKQVWTLYWGLAASFSTDSEASSALVGYPSEDGWQYEERSEQAASVALLIETYDGTAVPTFVDLPVSLR
ncbi:MAG: hypothetical protein SynsKO_25530 [Synoicihabitans sp.]